MAKRTKRQKAILIRGIFISFLVLIVVGISVLIVYIVKALNGGKTEKIPSQTSSVSEKADTSEPENKEPEKTEPEYVEVGGVKLDADFTCLLLVNGDNPLPDSYDSEVRASLVTVDKKYRNNDYVTQIHKDVYPYITAMVAAAQNDGVNLKVWSPFRSCAIQNDLFQKQVTRMKERGYKGKEAEDKAATVVARPGTSEHNTGLCADFNMADDAFENTKMYKWMTENAEDFGFVMRYDAKKQNITGVIHESWHWRFVGIKAAKEMNKLGMCLEEYVEYLKTK